MKSKQFFPTKKYQAWTISKFYQNAKKQIIAAFYGLLRDQKVKERVPAHILWGQYDLYTNTADRQLEKVKLQVHYTWTQMQKLDSL